MAAKPLVGIIMGSGSDARIMRGAAEILDGFGIAHEDQIVSAHRTPSRLQEYAEHAEKIGLRVIIAGAGGAAHLPGMIASFTTIPVVGVPILVYNDRGERTDVSALGGIDSLLSISEMPSGSPVAAVGINKAANAGIYAARILASGSAALRKKLEAHKRKAYRRVLAESEDMRRGGLAGFGTAGRRRSS